MTTWFRRHFWAMSDPSGKLPDRNCVIASLKTEEKAEKRAPEAFWIVDDPNFVWISFAIAIPDTSLAMLFRPQILQPIDLASIDVPA